MLELNACSYSFDVGFLSLCRFQKDIWVIRSNMFFSNLIVQNLIRGLPIPTASESFIPKTLISDDARLYVLGTSRHVSSNLNRFIAYDPGVGKMDELNRVENLPSDNLFSQPRKSNSVCDLLFCYHIAIYKRSTKTRSIIQRVYCVF